MKRKFVVPSKPMVNREEAPRPRERRKLGVRFEIVTGDGVSGLR